MTTTNPYAAPESQLDGATAEAADVALRESHIQHEAGVKAAGTLYYISAFFALLASFGVALIPESEIDVSPSFKVGTTAVYLVLGIASVVVGRGLRTLQRWVRIPTGILSTIGLLAFPVGTLINGYILYLVFSKQGTMVFSDQYRVAIENTPHIKYKTSIVVWIALGLLVALLALALAGAIFAS